MCLIAFAIDASARWPLVIAANRDESFDRPTLPLATWQSEKGTTIVSGRDVRAGGTWLGMTPRGRVAFLTNVREAAALKQAYPRSRGELVMRWLDGHMDADGFMAQTDSGAYGGFNLVLGDWQAGQWTWLSNRTFAEGSSIARRPGGVGWCCRKLEPGVYGLSNAALDTPWTKTVALKTALGQAIQADAEKDLEAPLWAALASRQTAPPGELPSTGVPPDLELALSSAFVDSPERAYGTRCTTLVVASPDTGGAGQERWMLNIGEKTHLKQPAPALTVGNPMPIEVRTVHQILLWESARSP